ncbi:NfeD family protein [Prosthecobacter sp.]|jgi:membrane-bound ClpP family serine protease|uniref:NfeD family protein n=1 Tax=Prosthecobacter sp. TaxID=1965333 RepID=UPI003783B281
MLASIAILTLFGIFLIMLETFLPGWVAGILGTISILAAVTLALISEDLVGWGTGSRLALVLGILTFSAAVLLTWLHFFAVKFFHRALTLTASVAAPASTAPANGAQGVALTELRPLGRAEIGGRHYDVRCQSGIASAGSRVEVIAAEPGNLLVRSIPS